MSIESWGHFCVVLYYCNYYYYHDKCALQKRFPIPFRLLITHKQETCKLVFSIKKELAEIKFAFLHL